MAKLRYIFMGSPPLAAQILERLSTGYAPPLKVITQEAKPAGRGKQLQPTAVESFARARSFPVAAIPNVNTPEMIADLKALNADVFLVAAFGQILKPEVLAIPKLFCLNVHASLLPKYRGAAPIQWALLNGDAETGVSIQRMVRKLDAGDVLLAERLTIQPDDTSETLLQKLSVLGGEALLQALTLIETGNYSFTPQEASQVTFAPKIEKEHARIDWNESAGKIALKVRALQPWPVAESTLGGQRLKIFKASVVDAKSGHPPGALWTDHSHELRVQCGDGRWLGLTEIQLENRKRLDIKSFLMAYRGQFPHTKMDSAPVSSESKP